MHPILASKPTATTGKLSSAFNKPKPALNQLSASLTPSRGNGHKTTAAAVTVDSDGNGSDDDWKFCNLCHVKFGSKQV